SAHNLASAREVFGEQHIEAKVREATLASRAAKEQPESKQPRRLPAQVLSSLCGLGFGRSDASAAVGQVLARGSGLDAEQLLRAVSAPLGAESELSRDGVAVPERPASAPQPAPSGRDPGRKRQPHFKNDT